MTVYEIHDLGKDSPSICAVTGDNTCKPLADFHRDDLEWIQELVDQANEPPAGPLT